MTELTSLKGVGATDAVRRLSRAAEDIAPSPTEDASREPALVDELKAIAKMRASKRKPLSEGSEEERAAMLDVLREAILRHSDVNFSAAKERLGSRGELRNADYSIVLGGELDGFHEKKSHIENAIRAADEVQHFGRPIEQDEMAWQEQRFQSLFVKRIASARGPYKFLIVATREGSQLYVSGAWRVYPDLVNCEGVDGPLALLERFVSFYGLRFSMGPHRQVRMIVHDVFAVETDQYGLPRFEIDFDHPDQEAIGFVLVRHSPLGVTEIRTAFVINRERYERDLVARGVQLRSGAVRAPGGSQWKAR